MADARVLIVDDNPTMREAITMIVEQEPHLHVCGEANNIAHALRQCETLKPDLALIDISLKGEDGIALVRQLVQDAPLIRTVVFSLHDEPFHIERARAAGAGGYAIKSAGVQEMLACIHSVLNGHACFPRSGAA